MTADITAFQRKDGRSGQGQQRRRNPREPRRSTGQEPASDGLFIVYATFPDAEIARTISRTLVEMRLVACANLLAMEGSIYEWNGAIEETKETAAFFKTTDTKVEAVIHQLERLHPFEVPCAVAWRLENGGQAFFDWVRLRVRHLHGV